MGQISATLEQAQRRGKEHNLPYSGLLLPEEAFLLWKNVPAAKLVDVRCKAEWDWTGRIPGAIEIEWASYPGMQLNPHFLNSLQQQVDKEALVMFICRSGARSHQAAMLAVQVGYTEVYNIAEGFEGDKDNLNHRNTINGWKVRKLPWEQS